MRGGGGYVGVWEGGRQVLGEWGWVGVGGEG